jgi:hypothetical protein
MADFIADGGKRVKMWSGTIVSPGASGWKRRRSGIGSKRGAPHQRVDLGRIVAMAACDAVAARSLEKTLGGLRQMAQGGLHKRKVADSGGSISSDAQTERDHFGTGRVGDAMEVLSAEDMAHLARQRWRSRFF